MATETDNLLDDVKAAAAEIAGGGSDADTGVPGGRESPAQSEGTSAPDQDGQRSAAARARDEGGRFAKAEDKPRETLTLKEPKTGGDVPPVSEPQGETKTGLEQNPVSDKPAPIAAPVEWKGAAKTKWDRLPREVQAEIAERHQATEQARAAFAPVEQAIAPYREAWMRDAGSVEAAIGQLGQFYRLYLDNPVGLIQHIAATRGINLGAPQGQQPPQGGAPQPAPDIASLIERAVQQHVAPIQERHAQAENQQLQDVISAFAADPKHPYFQDVKVHMGQLMAAGAAKNLDEAYDQAIWASSTIRPQLLSAQAEEANKARAAEVEKARKASSANLRGSPLPNGGSGPGSGNGSVHDDVRAAAAELAGNA